MSGLEVYYVPHRFRHTYSNIKSIDNRLSKIFFNGVISHGREIYAMETCLIPKVGLIELLHVKIFIGKGRDMQITSGGKHSSICA